MLNTVPSLMRCICGMSGPLGCILLRYFHKYQYRISGCTVLILTILWKSSSILALIASLCILDCLVVPAFLNHKQLTIHPTMTSDRATQNRLEPTRCRGLSLKQGEWGHFFSFTSNKFYQMSLEKKQCLLHTRVFASSRFICIFRNFS